MKLDYVRRFLFCVCEKGRGRKGMKKRGVLGGDV